MSLTAESAVRVLDAHSSFVQTGKDARCPVKLINFISIACLSSILWAAYVYGQTTEVEREVVAVS
jgi:hypothetical protein